MILANWLFLCAVVTICHAYPSGPPVSGNPGLCSNMFPSGHNATEQTTESPFQILVNTPNCYSSGQTVTVTVAIKANKDTYYEGLFMQARRTGVSNDAFGNFSASNTAFFKPYDCFSKTHSSVGHFDKKHFECETFTWQAPATANYSINFRATIVHETGEFWVGVTSATLDHSPNCSVTTTDTCSHTTGGVARDLPVVTVTMVGALLSLLIMALLR